MKKVILIFLLAIGMSLQAYAQRPKPVGRNAVYTVSIGKISFTPKDRRESLNSTLSSISQAATVGQVTVSEDKYASSVRASIIAGIGNAMRCNVIDRRFSANELRTLSPIMYADATISNISMTTQVNGSTTLYKGTIGVMLNLKDPHDGHVINSHLYNINGSDLAWVTTPEAAMNNTLKILTAQITRRINRLYPLNGQIIEGRSKTNKQKEVYIDIGSSQNLHSGMHFTVYYITKIAGREAREELGRIQVRKVMGKEISLCKVQRGGKAIKQALDSGKKIIVISTQ